MEAVDALAVDVATDNQSLGDGLLAIAKLGLAHSPEGRRVFPTQTVADNLLLGAFPRLTGARDHRAAKEASS